MTPARRSSPLCARMRYQRFAKKGDGKKYDRYRKGPAGGPDVESGGEWDESRRKESSLIGRRSDSGGDGQTMPIRSLVMASWSQVPEL